MSYPRKIGIYIVTFFLVMSSFCLQSDMRAHYDDNPLELEKLAVGVRIGSVILKEISPRLVEQRTKGCSFN